MSKRKYDTIRNVNEELVSRSVPPLDLTRAFIGSTPKDRFTNAYSKSVGMTNADLSKMITKQHQSGKVSDLAPYLYDAGRRGIPLPARVSSEYNIPDESYINELSRISSEPSSKYINAFLLASGATTGYAGLDLLQEQLANRSSSYSRGFKTIEDSADKIYNKILKGKKGRALEAITAKPISGVLGRGSQKGSKFISRLIGASGSAPLTVAATIPLMSSTVTNKLKGDNPKSVRYKIMAQIEEHPSVPIALAFSPMLGKAMYGGYKDIGRSLAARKAMGESAATALAKSLTRSGITLGKIGLGAAIPTAYLSMRKHMQKARDAEHNLINTKLKKQRGKGLT